MLLEVVLAAKALVTQRTWEGLVSTVDAPVTGQFLIAGERLPQPSWSHAKGLSPVCIRM